MTKLILINGNFNNQEKLVVKLKQWTDSATTKIIVNNSQNLLAAYTEFTQEFTTGNYEQGCVVWITGVTFTNLLNKKIPNKNIVTVQSLNYLNLIQNETPIDILVLGHEILGWKNLEIILKAFLTNSFN